MILRNFWLVKRREKLILKVVEWAQRNNKKVEHLTKDDIKEAIKSQKS